MSVDVATVEETAAYIEEYNQRRNGSTCKIDGCTNPPAQIRGRYAGLCTKHRKPKKVRPVKRTEPTLAQLATQIDQTHARLLETQNELTTLVTRLRTRLNQLTKEEQP